MILGNDKIDQVDRFTSQVVLFLQAYILGGIYCYNYLYYQA